jgi:O-antigen/teichoic acid export membrane protein
MSTSNSLSSVIRTRLAAHPSLSKIVANTGWMMVEKVLRLSLGVVVSALVARHLGPHDFGILSYALSLTTFLGAFVYLGLNGIVVRDLVKHPEENGLLLGSSLAFKIFGAFLGYAVLVAITFLGRTSGAETWILLIVGALLFFKPVEIIDFWFQSKVESKYSAIAKGSAFFLASLGKIFLVLAGASVMAIAGASLGEFMVAAVLLVVVYGYKGQSLRTWSFQLVKVKYLLKESWMLILSGFFAMVYLKIDQIMLRWMVGASEVGVYSVAVRISEVWYFIPSIIAASVFPALVEMKGDNRLKYYKKLQQGFDILFAIALSIAVIVVFVSKPVIILLFGLQYEQAGNILALHIWAGIFIFMRALFSKWIIIENKIPFSLYSQGLGAAINVILNLVLIKSYGGYGAAVATLISYATASYFMLFLASGTRPIAFMMSKSLLLPVRVIRYGKGVWD